MCVYKIIVSKRPFEPWQHTKQQQCSKWNFLLDTIYDQYDDFYAALTEQGSRDSHPGRSRWSRRWVRPSLQVTLPTYYELSINYIPPILPQIPLSCSNIWFEEFPPPYRCRPPMNFPEIFNCTNFAIIGCNPVVLAKFRAFYNSNFSHEISPSNTKFLYWSLSLSLHSWHILRLRFRDLGLMRMVLHWVFS